ncbi:unnamed protein product [Polarella glacialis]|uniref:K Homology domain-containing protein n=2 Tax=Polarella glacialis TaxID=89957 RepID=A0A813IXW9_POLGL|nr:unnamed protein product [Polarella glacialis]
MESIAVLIPTDRIARVIGKTGVGLKQIRESTGARVQVEQNPDATGALPSAATRRVELSGVSEQVAVSFALVIHKAFLGEQTCSVSVLIPADKAGSVVGRGGDNLRKVREECRVRISLEREPVVDANTNTQERMLALQGEMATMAQAMRMILGSPNAPNAFHVPAAMPLGLSFPAPVIPSALGFVGITGVVKPPGSDPDEIQLLMIVPDKLAGAVLGKGGAQVKQTASSAGCKVSMSTRDGTSDRRIVMMGNYSQLAAAQQIVFDQILEADHDFSEVLVTLLVRREAAGMVIGKQGASLKSIREQSSAKIQLAREEVEGHRPCTISGSLPNVLQAERLIVELVKNVPVESSSGGDVTMNGGAQIYSGLSLGPPFDLGFKRQDLSVPIPALVNVKPQRAPVDDQAEITKLLVPSQSAGAVIGKQGAGLKQLRESFGVHVEMQFAGESPHWSNDRVVILKGLLGARQLAVGAVLRMAFQSDEGEKCTLKVLVPSAQVGSVIGKQGSTLRAIREQCGIVAQVERDEVMGDRLVTAMGTLRQVSKAAGAILSILDGASYSQPNSVQEPLQQPQQQHQQQQQQQQLQLQHEVIAVPAAGQLLAQAMPAAVAMYPQVGPAPMVGALPNAFAQQSAQAQVIAGGAATGQWY